MKTFSLRLPERTRRMLHRQAKIKRISEGQLVRELLERELVPPAWMGNKPSHLRYWYQLDAVQKAIYERNWRL
jgi:hypothetical protein